MKEYQLKEKIYTLPGVEVVSFQLRSKKENHIILKILSEKDYLKWDYFCERVDEGCSGRIKIKKEYPLIYFILPTNDEKQQYLLDLPVDPKTELEVAIFDLEMHLDEKYYLIERPKVDTINIFLKITNRCNISCAYCYETPYRNMVGHNDVISFEDIDHFIDMATRYARNIVVTFHGGEPTLAGVAYYRKVMGEIFTKYPYATFNATIQTNSTNLNKEWFELFKLCGIQLGSSYNALDADLRYGSRADSLSSRIFDKILDAKDNGVDVGNLEVLTARGLEHIKEIYEFYKEVQLPNTFLPIFNEGSAKEISQSLIQDREKYEKLATDYFKYWLRDKTPALDRFASAYFQLLYTGIGSACDQGDDCLRTQLGLMSNGEIFPCDRPLKERYDLGNVKEFSSIEEIYDSPKYRRFEEERDRKIRKCRKCDMFNFCRGRCPMRDIEELDYADKISQVQCDEVKVNLLCMYRALMEVPFEELNFYARWLLTVNNRVLPSEIQSLVKFIGLGDKLGALSYTMDSTLSDKEWQVFTAFNEIDPEKRLFDDVFTLMGYDGSEAEDHRFENIRAALSDRSSAIEDALEAEK